MPVDILKSCRFRGQAAFPDGAGFHAEDRSTIREAVRLLEAEGIVETKPGKGVFVVKAPAVMSKDSCQNIQDFITMRSSLESFAVTLAIEKVDRKGIEQIAQRLMLFEQAVCSKNPREMALNDHLFHREIVRMSQNEFILHVVDNINWIQSSLRIAYFRNAEQVADSATWHRRIFHAMEKGDSERASNLMKEHILSASDGYQAALILLQGTNEREGGK